MNFEFIYWTFCIGIGFQFGSDTKNIPSRIYLTILGTILAPAILAIYIMEYLDPNK